MVVMMMMVIVVIIIGKLRQVLISAGMIFVIQLYCQMVHTNVSKDQLRMADHIFGVGIMRHFQFEAADIRIAAQSPKMRFLNSLHALQLRYLMNTNDITFSERSQWILSRISVGLQWTLGRLSADTS